MTYLSISQAVGATKIPKSHFNTAIRMNAPGIRHHRVYWEEFSPWYDQQKQEIEEQIKGKQVKKRDPHHDLKSYKLIREIIEKDLAIERQRGEQLNPKEVTEFLNTIPTVQLPILNAWKATYAEKLSGKSETECSVIMEQAINELLGKLRDVFKR